MANSCWTCLFRNWNKILFCKLYSPTPTGLHMYMFVCSISNDTEGRSRQVRNVGKKQQVKMGNAPFSDNSNDEDNFPQTVAAWSRIILCSVGQQCRPGASSPRSSRAPEPCSPPRPTPRLASCFSFWLWRMKKPYTRYLFCQGWSVESEYLLFGAYCISSRQWARVIQWYRQRWRTIR